MTDPKSVDNVKLNATNLRGVAHPIRVKMLGILRTDGPATATTLARRLDLNTGATSYHLRQLAEHGFVVEDPDRGVGRERWWKAAHASSTYTSADLPGDETTGQVYLRSVAQVQAEQLLRAADERATLPSRWRGVGTLSDYQLKLTPEELLGLTRELNEVIKRYRSAVPEPADAPDGSARITVQLQAFPTLTDADLDDEPETDA